MNISIVSVFPQLYSNFLQTSLIRRAQEEKKISFDITSFMSYVPPKERIDAPPFGPGTGMLIKPEVVQKAVETQENAHGPAYKIFFSPQGKQLDQRLLSTIAHQIKQKNHLLLLPARYEGMDARVEQHYADQVISVGNFVLMGGDLPAMMFLEGLLRLIPGVVGKQESVERDSFYGPFVDYPEYTQPVVWKGMEVPVIVRSGNHKAIDTWRLDQAVKKSVDDHFDWIKTSVLTDQQKILVSDTIPAHYVALMHSEVYVRPEKKIGTTSVTSLDIHDIARSCRTYGIRQYFLVTPLEDQKKIAQTLLDFWQEGPGAEYNKIRFDALARVELQQKFADVIAEIKKKEQKDPIVIATSAHSVKGVPRLTYFEQDKVWKQGRPVLILFGTGDGISHEFIQEHCDYVLGPVEGFSDFNHLSVRSAAAVVMDRWLGSNPKG